MSRLEDAKARCSRSLNRLCKWRAVFASWALGTRSAADGEVKQLRDLREAVMILRVEVTALTAVLHARGDLDGADFFDAQTIEAEELALAYERKFPGFRAVDEGIDIDLAAARKTMADLGFPP